MTGGGGGTTIRAAEPADVDALADTAIAAWEEGFRGIVPERVDPRTAWQPARIAERLAAPAADGSAILAAEVDGDVRGLVLYGPSRDRRAAPHEGEIVALYVHPQNWRSGVGRALVEGALEALTAAGHSEAIVWTLAESARNLAFYDSLGFARDGGTQRRPSFGSPLEVRFRISLGGREAIAGL
ncbi:MAG: family N-acetyltransferase [Solirubrobacterales bacterium]|nr:family N-acetyltransferase [Solirubrobacterales bacterium]